MVQRMLACLHALDHFKNCNSISMQTKEHWRDVVLRGPPWSAEEQVGSLAIIAGPTLMD